MKYINVKKVIAVVSAGFILMSMTGCKKEEKDYSKKQEPIVNEYIQDETKKEELEYIEPETKETLNSVENNEAEVIKYFENLEEEVNDLLNEDNLDKMKEKLINIVVTGIDFIFYDTEIKGVTFGELTTEAKIKIMEIVSSIDDKIESKIPGYKEIIKDKIGQGYDYVSEKLDDALTYADGKLDEKYGEDYEDAKNKASEIIGDIKEEATDIYGNVSEDVKEGWSKIKGWYETKTNKG